MAQAIQIATPPPPPIRYISEKAVSDITGFSLSKLQQDRFYRKGIPYIKIGRNIRYADAIQQEENTAKRKRRPSTSWWE